MKTKPTYEQVRHGQRTGRVDVLPPEAELPLYTDLVGQYRGCTKLLRVTNRLERRQMQELMEHPGLAHLSRKARKQVIWNPRHNIPGELSPEVTRLLAIHYKLRHIHKERKQQAKALQLALEKHRLTPTDALWVSVAKSVLPQDTLDHIDALVQRALDDSKMAQE